jgi:branched-subunit amino acid ABC-type transport system permease component
VNELLPFLVLGLASGSVYALAAMGLVVTYTTSGVFNFAHGTLGMVIAYAFVELREERGVPTPVALAVCLGVIAPLLGLGLDRLFSRLAGRTAANYLVASIGLLVALQGMAIIRYGADARSVTPLFPRRSAFTVGSLQVGFDQVAIIVLALALGLGLKLFFAHSHLGLATRAVVDDPELTGLTGTDRRLVTTLAWIIGVVYAGISGILVAPLVGLDAVLLTLLVLQALAAAIIGGLRHLTLTYAGGLAVGVAAAVATKLVATHRDLSGLPAAMPFIVLFMVLVVSHPRRFVEVRDERRALRVGARAFEPRLPWLGVAAGTAVALVVGARSGEADLVTSTSTVAFVLVFASLGLLVGQARLVSLCHATFVVLGATTLSHLLAAGLPYGPALLLTGLILAPVGAVLAVPALRLPALFLAVATFGFGVLAERLLYPSSLVFGGEHSRVPRPAGFVGDRPFFYLTLAVVVVAVVAIEWLRAGRLGLLQRALADSPTAVTGIGVSPIVSRVLVFAAASFFAGVAGGLLGSVSETVSPSSFTFADSLVWLAVLVAAGPTTLGGAVLAALLLSQLPAAITDPAFADWLPVAFGASAIVFAGSPNGIAGLLHPDISVWAARSRWRLDRSPHRERLVARQMTPDSPTKSTPLTTAEGTT